MNKEKDLSEWYSWILKEADIVDIRYPVKGMPVYKPYGYFMLKKILSMLEELLEKNGYESAWFPIFIPEDIFNKETEHILGFSKETFRIKEDENTYIIRPTSETEMYYMYSLWISSYADLPLKIYMTNTVYRNETKATRPLLRGSEILWNEAHSAHKDLDDAMRHIKLSIDIYSQIYKKLHIPFIWLKRPEWDKFAGAEITFAADTITPDGRFLQIGTTHLLGRKFSRVFNIKFDDKHPYIKIDDKTFEAYSKDGKIKIIIKIEGKNMEIYLYENNIEKQIIKATLDKEYEISEDNEELIKRIDEIIKKYIGNIELDNSKYVWQISFGLSMRVLGGMIMILGDDKGLLLPFDIAPIQIVIIPIYYSDEEKKKVLEYAKKVYDLLKEKYRVKIDYNENKTPGWKFNYYEMKGVPIRIEIGKKEAEENYVTIGIRKYNENSKKLEIEFDYVLNSIEKLIEDYEKSLDDIAYKKFNEKIVYVEDINSFEKAIQEGKVVKARFCMNEDCYRNIKEKYSVEVRGTTIEPEISEGKCIFCGRDAKYIVYIGKSY